MADEQHFTLEEAAHELGRSKCASWGHDLETVLKGPLFEPALLVCRCCGLQWRVASSRRATAFDYVARRAEWPIAQRPVDGEDPPLYLSGVRDHRRVLWLALHDPKSGDRMTMLAEDLEAAVQYVAGHSVPGADL